MSLARFVVWAPHRSAVTLMIKKVGDSTPVKWRWKETTRDGGSRLNRCRTTALANSITASCSTTLTPCCRIRAPAASPMACTAGRGPSMRTSFRSDQKWTGKQLAGIIYELHVGTFTSEGTLTAAIDRLDHLVKLGIDFVELMPVNAFNGPHNWGYDGALVCRTRGIWRPLGYMQFVDACHRAGLGVIQDVVYNHLGPSGNYLPQFGPYLMNALAPTSGVIRQPGRRGVRRGPPLHHRQRLDVPSTTTWTGCASTPCTPCTTREQRTCSRS